MTGEYAFIISMMTWSFSRLNYSCLSEWQRHYLECEEQQGNFYAEFGSLMHKCLEIYALGILPDSQILEYYDTNFDDYCQTYFPEDKKEEYYLQGYEYLAHLSENLPLDKYEIIGVEKELSFELKEYREEYRDENGELPVYKMTGFIDLLLKNTQTGELEIRDHKSSQMRFKKNGDPYKSDEEHWQAFKRQLYLYAVPLVEAGETVSCLSWNLFRQGVIKSIPFDVKALREAYDWALDTIHLLEKEDEWEPKQDFFYCRNLCGYRHNCFATQADGQEERYDWY